MWSVLINFPSSNKTGKCKINDTFLLFTEIFFFSHSLLNNSRHLLTFNSHKWCRINEKNSQKKENPHKPEKYGGKQTKKGKS